MGAFTTLAIDIGSTLGYCLAKDGVIVDSGEVTLSAKDAHPGLRMLRFQEWLNKYKYEVNEILYENVQFITSTSQILLYGKLLGQLEVFTLANKIRMSHLTPTAIKKDFTGAGNSKKDVVCDVAMRLGWKGGTPGTDNRNNEADAIALFWVVSVRRGVEPSFPKERQLFTIDEPEIISVP